MSFLTAGYWNIGDGMEKGFLDDIFGNTIINAQRERVLHAVGELTANGANTDGTTYLDIQGTHFAANGDKLGNQLLRWEVETYGGGGYIKLYNVTDSADVSGSEQEIPAAGTTETLSILPASSANYFSLVSGEKKYKVKYKAKTAGTYVFVRNIRIVGIYTT